LKENKKGKKEAKKKFDNIIEKLCLVLSFYGEDKIVKDLEGNKSDEGKMANPQDNITKWKKGGPIRPDSLSKVSVAARLPGENFFSE
jgi:hypothetical protein